MSDSQLIEDFLQPVDLSAVLGDDELNAAQLGRNIQTYAFQFPDLEKVDMVLLGITDERGTGNGVSLSEAPTLIRKNLYRLYYWHTDVRIADIGNVSSGATLKDTYAAAKAVIKELIDAGKKVVILGGSHDLTLAQYGAYAQRQQIIEASCIDAFINLNNETPIRSENFLLEMLTGEPNFIRHYNHIGFQSYFVHPTILQTMDRLRFDCFRVGVVKDALEEMEPVIRGTHLLSIDMTALANAYAPANRTTPNGLNGMDICTLTRFAGMSEELTTLGIYGYNAKLDKDELTSIQVAQMIWYFIDGTSKSKAESSLEDRHNFIEYHTTIAETDALFLKSKKTGRWWLQLPNKKFIACSATDYQLAIHSEIPERWLRAQERD
jgi:formiminoglutamase